MEEESIESSNIERTENLTNEDIIETISLINQDENDQNTSITMDRCNETTIEMSLNVGDTFKDGKTEEINEECDIDQFLLKINCNKSIELDENKNVTFNETINQFSSNNVENIEERFKREGILDSLTLEDSGNIELCEADSKKDKLTEIEKFQDIYEKNIDDTNKISKVIEAFEIGDNCEWEPILSTVNDKLGEMDSSSVKEFKENNQENHTILSSMVEEIDKNLEEMDNFITDNVDDNISKKCMKDNVENKNDFSKKNDTDQFIENFVDPIMKVDESEVKEISDKDSNKIICDVRSEHDKEDVGQENAVKIESNIFKDHFVLENTKCDLMFGKNDENIESTLNEEDSIKPSDIENNEDFEESQKSDIIDTIEKVGVKEVMEPTISIQVLHQLEDEKLAFEVQEKYDTQLYEDDQSGLNLDLHETSEKEKVYRNNNKELEVEALQEVNEQNTDKEISDYFNKELNKSLEDIHENKEKSEIHEEILENINLELSDDKNKVILVSMKLSKKDEIENEQYSEETVKTKHDTLQQTSGEETLKCNAVGIRNDITSKCKDIISWTHPLPSAFVFSVIILMEVCFMMEYSVISISAYFGIFLVLASFFYKIAVSIGIINTQFSKNLAFDIEDFKKFIGVIIYYVDYIHREIKSIAYIESYCKNLKIFIFLWVLTYVGQIFYLQSLIFIGSLLLFTVPVIYIKFEKELDQLSNNLINNVNGIMNKVKCTTPLC